MLTTGQESPMNRPVATALVAAACVALVSSCDEATTPDDGVQPARILIGGALPNPNQNDCRWYTEHGQQAIPGVNCFEPERLLAFIDSTASNLHVALVDMALSSEAYGADPGYMRCDFPSGGFFTSYLIPTKRLEVLDDYDQPNLGRSLASRSPPAPVLAWGMLQYACDNVVM